jgi:hypothetical protein
MRASIQVRQRREEAAKARQAEGRAPGWSADGVASSRLGSVCCFVICCVVLYGVVFFYIYVCLDVYDVYEGCIGWVVDGSMNVQ